MTEAESQLKYEQLNQSRICSVYVCVVNAELLTPSAAALLTIGRAHTHGTVTVDVDLVKTTMLPS